MRTLRLSALALCGPLLAANALAQFPQLITDFEISGAGDPYVVQAASLGDLSVVLFQDPAEADVTTANVLADTFATLSGGAPPLPSTQESFVASFAGFNGANASAQFLDIRFEWTNPADTNRWALVETLQSPTLGDPSLHLGGKVRFYVNIPDCAQFEYPGLFTLTPEVGIALLVSETGRRIPQGFQDNNVLTGDFEFVGVDSVADANTANPIPVPSNFIPLTDAFCEGLTTGPAGNWRLVEFDLPVENVIGWTFRGGDGVLDATGSGDGVNRGVLAGIVLAVRQTDSTSDFVEVLVDQITFEAPVTEPAPAPAIASPVVASDSVVQVNQVVTLATNVALEIDRSDGDNNDPFVADETFNVAPGLSITGEERFVTVNVAPALAIGDRIRARQQVNADVGPYSLIVSVNPPAAFSATLSLDEDGTLGTAAVFEWVGATTVIPPAGTQGKPIFPQNGVWQKLEFSLIPGVEPVISFAGGNGQLQPNGGLYNIDAMFFTIDSTSPNAGPYQVFIDRVYYISAADEELVLADAEASNPFPSFRGQSTSINRASALSTLTSYDGISSNRQAWDFPDLAANNTHAPFRPAVTFPDSAKAVGMWILVEDPRTSPLQLPAVEQSIIGNAPAVTVSNIDPTATIVRLLVNGVAAGSVNPAGAGSVNVTPSVALALGDSVSAEYDTASDTSDVAYPRVVQRPSAPTVQGPLVAGQTSVTVTGVLNTGNGVSNLVRVFDGNTQIGSANPGGNSSVVVNVTPALSVGQQISARQVVNGAESDNGAPVGVGTGVSVCVVINEFQYDDSGTDTREFVELYNAESVPVDISGWTLRSSDTVAPPGDNNPDYVVPAATILAAGDYYVFGHAIVPNVDQVLVGADLWENDNEAIQLLDDNGVLVDTVVYEFNKGNVAVSPAEGGIFANFSSIDGNEQAWGRWFDGYDTGDNGRDFGTLAATPGAANNPAPVSPFTDNLDGVIGTNVTNWIGSFVRLRYIDPTVATSPNPNVIPASPQGGNAAVCWDPAGGGNGCALIDEARYNVGFSMQVYIQSNGAEFTAGNAAAGERVDWSIGLGNMDQLANFPTANGNTGLAWEFRIIEDGDTGAVGTLQLLLVDRNNGGNDGVTLLSVPPGDLTTGWHTLTLEQNYGSYSASFDAITTSGTIATNGPATLQIGFREAVAGVPAALRPPTIDALTITAPTPPVLGECCTDCYCDDLTEAMCDAIGGDFASGCAGDVDGDGDTDIDDLLLLLGAFGVGAGGDLDGDNDTDIDDLLILLGDLGCA